MAVAFSTAAEGILQKNVETSTDVEYLFVGDWKQFLEIERCCSWIKDGGYKRVALQFPDSYLKKSTSVAAVLRTETSVEVFILADTSYGSCCVDEVAAQHYTADAIIHFGHSCLSTSDRLPVLNIFGKGDIDVKDCATKLLNCLPDAQSKIVVLCAVEYDHCKAELEDLIKGQYNEVMVPELYHQSAISRDELMSDSSNEVSTLQLKSRSLFEMFGRKFDLPKGNKIDDFIIFYVGEDSMFMTNMMVTCRETKFYSYKPRTKICQKEDITVNKLLMKRFYLVEKVKDAQVVGILVATLSVAKYLDIVQRLKSLLSHVGKKYYVFSVGKINVPKLANFPEVDIYVLVSCPESIIWDSYEYYRPIVTPFEVELACDPDRDWTGDLVLDYKKLLPDGDSYRRVDWDKPVSSVDVSLITGGVRQLGTGTEESSSGDNQAVATRDPMSVTAVSGELFAGRSWQGLDPKLGQSAVTKAVQGRKGIAIQYEEEPS